jgi:hypothetical protein
LSWRDEIDIVLQEWIAALSGGQGRQRWQRVGTARSGGEPGLYVVDIRASDLTADQPDELRLALLDLNGRHERLKNLETRKPNWPRWRRPLRSQSAGRWWRRRLMTTRKARSPHTLPEVLLAVAKAAKCAVLLGDFMQLGSVLPRALQDSDRQEVNVTHEIQALRGTERA